MSLIRGDADAQSRRSSRRWAAASFGVHAALAAMLVAGALLFPKKKPVEADTPAEIHIVVGDNASLTGGPAMQTAAPASPPAAPPGAPVAQSAPPPDVTAEPPPAAETATSPPDAPGEIAAAPAVAPPAPAAKAAAPAPRQTATAPAAPAPAPPQSGDMEIQLGDGVAATAAEIERENGRQLAESDPTNIAPEYPAEAARRRESGTVVLRVFIDAAGDVARVEIAQSSGSRLLDKSAEDRIATWHYRPASLAGRPMADMKYESIRFALD